MFISPNRERLSEMTICRTFNQKVAFGWRNMSSMHPTTTYPALSLPEVWISSYQSAKTDQHSFHIQRSFIRPDNSEMPVNLTCILLQHRENVHTEQRSHQLEIKPNTCLLAEWGLGSALTGDSLSELDCVPGQSELSGAHTWQAFFSPFGYL